MIKEDRKIFNKRSYQIEDKVFKSTLKIFIETHHSIHSLNITQNKVNDDYISKIQRSVYNYSRRLDCIRLMMITLARFKDQFTTTPGVSTV